MRDILQYIRSGTTREQIQSLIANNQTEDALVLLAKTNGDALLLQAQFNSGKKNFNLGLIDFNEWQRIQARVNYGALEMAARTPFAGSAEQGSAKSKVFISYNHNDIFAMRAVKNVLEDNGIDVFVDISNMGVGDNIDVFMEKALRENQFILSIISKNSLKAGWVTQDLSSALLRDFGRKWLPVLLDKSCFDDNFYDNTLDEFDKRIEDLRATIKQALDKNRNIRPFQEELDRIHEMKNDFGKTIKYLRNHLCVDVSGELFDTGMNQVVDTVKQN